MITSAPRAPSPLAEPLDPRRELEELREHVGRFDYRVSLPGVSDTEDVQATLDHGVLTVRVPKPEHAKRRRIAVGSAPR